MCCSTPTDTRASYQIDFKVKIAKFSFKQLHLSHSDKHSGNYFPTRKSLAKSLGHSLMSTPACVNTGPQEDCTDSFHGAPGQGPSKGPVLRTETVQRNGN